MSSLADQLKVVLENYIQELPDNVSIEFQTLPPRQNFQHYYLTIKKPMSFSKVQRSLKSYNTPQSFLNDVCQIPWNAKFYNSEESILFKYANVLEEQIKSSLIPALKEFSPSITYPHLGNLPDENEDEFSTSSESTAAQNNLQESSVKPNTPMTNSNDNGTAGSESAVTAAAPTSSSLSSQIVDKQQSESVQQDSVITALPQQETLGTSNGNFSSMPPTEATPVPPTVHANPYVSSYAQSSGTPQPLQSSLLSQAGHYMQQSHSPLETATQQNQQSSLPLVSVPLQQVPLQQVPLQQVPQNFVPNNVQLSSLNSYYSTQSSDTGFVYKYIPEQVTHIRNLNEPRKRGRPSIKRFIEQQFQYVSKILRKKSEGAYNKLYELPSKETNPEYFEVVKRPLSLEAIKHAIKKNYIRTSSQLREFFNLMIDNHKLYYADNYNEVMLANSFLQDFEAAMQQYEREEQAEGQELREPLDKVEYNGSIYEVGSWVLLYNRVNPSLPVIGHVFNIWKETDDGTVWMSVSWYLRPEQTVHRVDRTFYANEVFKSAQTRIHPMEDIIGKCCVVFFTRYQRADPMEREGPIFICEFRYNDSDKKFNKIRTWKGCIPEAVRELPDQDIPVPNRVFIKRESPLKHKLPLNAQPTANPPPLSDTRDEMQPAEGNVYIGLPLPKDDLGEYYPSPFETPKYIVQPGQEIPPNVIIDQESLTFCDPTRSTVNSLPHKASQRLASLNSTLAKTVGSNNLSIPVPGRFTNSMQPSPDMLIPPNLLQQQQQQQKQLLLKQQQQQQQQMMKQKQSLNSSQSGQLGNIPANPPMQNMPGAQRVANRASQNSGGSQYSSSSKNKASKLVKTNKQNKIQKPVSKKAPTQSEPMNNRGIASFLKGRSDKVVFDTSASYILSDVLMENIEPALRTDLLNQQKSLEMHPNLKNNSSTQGKVGKMRGDIIWFRGTSSKVARRLIDSKKFGNKFDDLKPSVEYLAWKIEQQKKEQNK